MTDITDNIVGFCNERRPRTKMAFGRISELRSRTSLDGLGPCRVLDTLVLYGDLK